jgi:hypothetical protein
LLLIVRLPVSDPLAVGANWTCSVSDCPGFNVAGRLAPTREKPVPETDAELTVTAAVPDDESVNDCTPEAFTATLPKLNVLALKVSCGVVVAAVPVPLNDTVFVLPVDELLRIVRLPVSDPLAFGANCTCSVNC